MNSRMNSCVARCGSLVKLATDWGGRRMRTIIIRIVFLILSEYGGWIPSESLCPFCCLYFSETLQNAHHCFVYVSGNYSRPWLFFYLSKLTEACESEVFIQGLNQETIFILERNWNTNGMHLNRSLWYTKLIIKQYWPYLTFTLHFLSFFNI